MDLYPNLDVFVNDEKKHALIDSKQMIDFIESDKVKTLYAEPDIMRHVNKDLWKEKLLI